MAGIRIGGDSEAFLAVVRETWHDARGMAPSRWPTRSAAAVILFLAAFEIFGCMLCSADTCQLAGTLTHQSHQTKSSGDDCLCCCGHLLVASAVHIEPVTLVALGPQPEPTQATIERHAAVYHPPRALTV